MDLDYVALCLVWIIFCSLGFYSISIVAQTLYCFTLLEQNRFPPYRFNTLPYGGCSDTPKFGSMWVELKTFQSNYFFPLSKHLTIVFQGRRICLELQERAFYKPQLNSCFRKIMSLFFKRVTQKKKLPLVVVANSIYVFNVRLK